MDELQEPIIVKKENAKHVFPESDEDDGGEEPYDDYLGDDPIMEGDNDGEEYDPFLHRYISCLDSSLNRVLGGRSVR